MIIYIFVILTSIIFISLGLLSKRKYHNFIYYLFITIGLLLPCIIAGLRNNSIGSDTDFYILGLFEQVSSFSSPINYIKEMSNFWQINDLVYLMVTFIVGKCFNNFNMLLFIMELLIVLPVYKSIEKYSVKDTNIIYGMLLFYLFWYNVTFNMLRQSLALAFSLLGIAYMDKKKYKLSILFSLICIGFHKSGILTLFIIALMYIFNHLKINNRQKKKLSKFIIILSICSVATFILSIPIANHFNLFKIPIFEKIHFIEYIKNYKFDFSFIDNFMYLYVFVIIYIGKNVIELSNINYLFYKTLSIISIIFLQIGMIIPYAERFSFYFIYPIIINILPIALERKALKENVIIKILTIFIFLGYWILIFCILRVHNTVPYIFFYK